MIGLASAVARPPGALEATCCRVQEPARPGLVLGPARRREGASCDKPFLLPASILGISDIRVKGTLTDTEPRQVQIRQVFAGHSHVTETGSRAGRTLHC